MSVILCALSLAAAVSVIKNATMSDGAYPDIGVDADTRQFSRGPGWVFERCRGP
jgi:hypothetical protein